ncbi:MAG: acyl--CoA ligase, partial [Gammaproteobacteria bacterium]|nr:acyl--CoA ligase [Gammaproteobacteria bacterium]
MDIADIRRATKKLTGPSQPYEMHEVAVDGVVLPVFRAAPPNLRGLFESSLAFAGRDFYVFQGERFTFQQTWDIAASVANALRRDGVRPGDRIAIASRNYPEWIFAFMGVTSIGAIAVCMNAWWTTEELAYGLEDSGARLVFADAERTRPARATARHARHHRGRRSQSLTEIIPAGARLGCIHRGVFASNANGGCRARRQRDHSLHIRVDGASQGRAGNASQHHPRRNGLGMWCRDRGRACPETVDPNPEFLPAMMLAVPLFHVAGLNVQFMSSFRTGRKLVGMYKWDPEEALRLIESERVTGFNGVPTMSWELVQSPNFDKYDLRSLKSAGGGGSAMAPEHARQISKKLTPGGGAAGTGYGMTETNGLGTSIAGADLAGRPRSAGRPIPPVVTIRVVDVDGNELPRGKTGEIWFKGAMNFRGYWNNPSATLATLTDGWVHSGDIGHMDDQDFVFITDRAKDMIIRGGEN